MAVVQYTYTHKQYREQHNQHKQYIEQHIYWQGAQIVEPLAMPVLSCLLLVTAPCPCSLTVAPVSTCLYVVKFYAETRRLSVLRVELF